MSETAYVLQCSLCNVPIPLSHIPGHTYTSVHYKTYYTSVHFNHVEFTGNCTAAFSLNLLVWCFVALLSSSS